MRIALVTAELDACGAELVVRRLATGLQGRGHAVFIYCLQHATVPVDELRAAGVVVREARSVGRDPGLMVKLWHWLRADRIELMHAHANVPLVYAWPGAALLRLPVVHVRHGQLLATPRRYRQVADTLARFVTQTVLVAESERAHLPPGRLRETAIHIPNGRDLPPPDRAAARARLAALCGRGLGDAVVLSIGTLCAEKDTLGLLRAFHGLRAAGQCATLVCVGAARPAAYGVQARTLVHELGLDDAVVFADDVPEAWRLMAGADVFCLSSVTEAMPNVIVEAQSQAVPIVATRVGDVPRMLDDGRLGLLVPPGDPAALAAALRATLGDPAAARVRVQRAAEAYAARHGVQQMITRYEAVYAACRRTPPTQRHTQSHAPTARPRVVMAGPGPTQLGGVSAVIDNLVTGPLQTTCDVVRHVTPAPGTRARGIGAALRTHLRALWQLAGQIRRTHADIVHVHTSSFNAFFRSTLDVLVARLLRRRVCLHVHGGRFAEFCTAAPWWQRGVIRTVCRHVDAVVVLSRQWQMRLGRLLPGARLAIVPNGVPIPAPTPRDAPPHEPCHFVFLGVQRRQKGLAELLAAAATLRRQQIPFRLTVAGPTAAGEEDWPAATAALQLSDAVRFSGPVTGAAKRELLASADCLVLPSHVEALPLVVLEAAAAGCAVVATSVGALPEVFAPDAKIAVGDTSDSIAPLVPPQDAAALATALHRIATDVTHRNDIARRIHTRVAERYSDTAAATCLRALYADMQRGRVAEYASRTRRRSVLEHLVRTILYPIHERLRGRATLAVRDELTQLAAGTAADLVQDRQQRLHNLLTAVQAHQPYYAAALAEADVQPDAADLACELQKLPVLDKATVRARGADMLWRGVPGGPLPATSGGTSGDTLHFHVDHIRTAQDQGARLFMQSLYGVQAGDRRVYLWGSPIEQRERRVHRLRDALLNEQLLNAFELAPGDMDAHLARIRRTQPRLIYGYPSAVARLARHAAPHCRRSDFVQLELVVLTGEEVTPAQRTQIAQTFGCAVAVEYGSREVGLIAHTCPAGTLHVVAPHVHVEIVANGVPVATGQAGEIVVTTLNTRAQPLIRYRLGDVGRLLPRPCACGLPFPTLELLGGRMTGFIALPDGRVCHGALSAHVLRDVTGIVEFRVRQPSLERVIVQLVTTPAFAADGAEQIRARYRRIFGTQVAVEVDCVDRLPPDPSGKRRHTISEVAPDYFDFEVLMPSSNDDGQ